MIDPQNYDFSRRSFMKGGTTAAAIMAFDGPRSIARAMSMALPEQDRPLLLHNNENPMGPGEKVIAAMNEAMDSGFASLYGLPSRATTAAISEANDVPARNIMLGCGSTQLLRTATQVFTNMDRPLVTAAPTYEECTRAANRNNTPIRTVPLDSDLMIDLDGMAEASKGAGLLFLCNPNNPTGTAHGADKVGAFIDKVLANSDAILIIDEAYYDYVTDPNFKTEIPRALKEERVLVARTFSKGHGMAGMRLGYCVTHPDVRDKMSQFQFGGTLNAPALLAGTTSIKDTDRIDKERARNTAAKKFTVDWFKSKGMPATDSQTSFIFVKTGVRAATFRNGCAERNIKVGRDFPPYQNEWARISIGTMDEMKRAIGVFDRVLEASGGIPKQKAG